MYEIDKIGPVNLKWGKRNTKNKQGKIVKVSSENSVHYTVELVSLSS